MKTRLGVLMSVAALAALLVLPAAASASTSLTKLEQQVVTLVNQKRAARGLSALRVNLKLVDAARAHSTEMGDRQYFSHDSAGGESFSRRILRYGYSRADYSSWSVGENIAWGSGLYATALATVRAWMKSPAHRAVILTARFRDIGVGTVTSAEGYSGVGTPVTFFTMDVGRRVR